MTGNLLSNRDNTPGNTRTASPTVSDQSDDDPHHFPSKWVSDVQTLLRKTRLRLLAGFRVSTSGELFSVRPTQERGVDAFDALSSYSLGRM